VRDGYGYITQELSLALAEYGHEVWLEPHRGWYSDEQQKPGLQKLKRKLSSVDFELIIYYPGVITSPHKSGILTMYEASKLPTQWVKMLSGYTNVFGPSKFVVDVFKSSGISSKIRLLPLGIDLDFYSYREREVEDVFTFFSLGKMEPRKNSHVLVEAFAKAFGVREDVKLVIKTRERFVPQELRGNNIPRNVEIIEKTMTETELRELYYDAHCFVYPSKGEGFSFPPRNALATGLPTIVTGWSALNEINGAIKIPVKSMSPMPPCGFSYGEEANLLMADVNSDVLAELLLGVYNDYEGTKNRTKESYHEISWQQSAELVTEVIKGVL
jgi:hypothetical protein